MDEVHVGMETLVENFSAFAGMINDLSDLGTETTEATATNVNAGMGK